MPPLRCIPYDLLVFSHEEICLVDPPPLLNFSREQQWERSLSTTEVIPWTQRATIRSSSTAHTSRPKMDAKYGQSRLGKRRLGLRSRQIPISSSDLQIRHFWGRATAPFLDEVDATVSRHLPRGFATTSDSDNESFSFCGPLPNASLHFLILRQFIAHMSIFFQQLIVMQDQPSPHPQRHLQRGCCNGTHIRQHSGAGGAYRNAGKRLSCRA